MSRDNRVRLSDEEHNKLKAYQESEYDKSIPLGFIISELIPDE